MKKITQNLKWLVTLLTMIVSMGAWATDFTLSSSSAENITKDGITVSFDQASGSTAPAWYNAGLRLYANNTITISSANNITGITFNWEKQGSKAFASVSASVGTYAHPSAAGEGTWTGSSKSITFTLGSSGQLQLNTFTVTCETGGETPVETVATPTFSVAEGTYTKTQSVVISCATDGASVYYTTDGTEPSTASSLYSDPLTISSTTTIKAIAVKDGYKNSEIATATYTISTPVSGYTIDFENALVNYIDWTFTNIGTSSETIEAHGGESYGANLNEKGNGVTSATIQTKEPVVNPATFTCYVSKTSSNTKASTWYVEVSSDGSTWTTVISQNAASMNKGEWNEVSADLSNYSNVYVRLRYDGSTAIRAVDDISVTLGETVDVTVTEGGKMESNGKYYATYSNAEKALDFSAVEGLKAYYVTSASTSALTITEASKVPAGTAVLIEGAEAKTYQVPVVTSGTDNTSNNRLLVSDGNVLGDGKTIYVLGNGKNGVGFYLKKKDSAIAAGKAYLEIAAGEAKSFLSLGGDDAVAISNVEAEQGTGVLYNLNGQRVAAPVKGGLYIMNGKKVLVK